MKRLALTRKKAKSMADGCQRLRVTCSAISSVGDSCVPCELFCLAVLPSSESLEGNIQ